MKISKKNLQNIIKEELLSVLEQKRRTETPPISLRDSEPKKRATTQKQSNNNNIIQPPPPRRSTGQQLIDSGFLI